MAYGRKREMFRIGNCEGGEERLNPRYQPDSGQLWKGFVAFVLIVAMILFATPVAAIHPYFKLHLPDRTKRNNNKQKLDRGEYNNRRT